MYQDTDAELEKLDGIYGWIQTQCHSHESIRGWAFRVGGMGMGGATAWQYGYPSKSEARERAIDLAEELTKSRIRSLTKEVERSQDTLAKIHELQRQRTGIYG